MNNSLTAPCPGERPAGVIVRRENSREDEHLLDAATASIHGPSAVAGIRRSTRRGDGPFSNRSGEEPSQCGLTEGLPVGFPSSPAHLTRVADLDLEERPDDGPATRAADQGLVGE